MVWIELLRLLEQAERETGGAPLVSVLGEVVALELTAELGYMPSDVTTWAWNPFLGPDVDEAVIAVRADLHLPAPLLAEVEVTRARMPIVMSRAALEIYQQLRRDGMSCAMAYDCAQALER